MTISGVSDHPLTPAQAIDTMHWLMEETKPMFLRALRQDYASTKDPKYFPDLEKASLIYYCGLAQSFIDCTLQDTGYTSKPFAIQSLDGKSAQKHVALTAEIKTTDGVKRYLVDPTFKQFCTGDEKSPATVIANMPDGEYITKSLLKDGFIELTPAVANSYLSAFCNGICPFASQKELMDFFDNPPLHEHNRYFSKETLVQKGLIDRSVPHKRPTA